MALPNLQCWAYWFLARFSLSIRRVSRKMRLSDEERQSRIDSFMAEVERLHLLVPGLVFINMDETSVEYSPVPN
jgi:hypothetical protein